MIRVGKEQKQLSYPTAAEVCGGVAGERDIADGLHNKYAENEEDITSKIGMH